MEKTWSKRNFWLSAIFSSTRAGPWFRPFLRPGQKIHVPPIFSKKFTNIFFAPGVRYNICENQSFDFPNFWVIQFFSFWQFGTYGSTRSLLRVAFDKEIPLHDRTQLKKYWIFHPRHLTGPFQGYLWIYDGFNGQQIRSKIANMLYLSFWQLAIFDLICCPLNPSYIQR